MSISTCILNGHITWILPNFLHDLELLHNGVLIVYSGTFVLDLVHTKILSLCCNQQLIKLYCPFYFLVYFR